METEQPLRLSDVFVSIHDPRQPGKVKHDFVELLVVAVNGVLVGADTFEEIELWANEKLDWLRSYLRLQNGIPSHDTFGRVFGLIDPGQFEQAFRRWMRGVLPALSDEVVAIDGKTRGPRRQAGAGPARDGGKIQREDRHSGVTFHTGAGRRDGNDRRHGNPLR